MKTLTKYTLILLCTLPVSGCFNEDDKSYQGSVETSENVVQEVFTEAKAVAYCGERNTLKLSEINSRLIDETFVKVIDVDGYVWELSRAKCNIKYLK